MTSGSSPERREDRSSVQIGPKIFVLALDKLRGLWYCTLEFLRQKFHFSPLIKRCQALGFSLNEIMEILELRITPKSTCADMKLRVGEKLTDVDRKIQELVHIRDALSRLVKKCTGKGPIGSCPILEELYQ